VIWRITTWMLRPSSPPWKRRLHCGVKLELRQQDVGKYGIRPSERN
jgi:hypothetical protein